MRKKNVTNKVVNKILDVTIDKMSDNAEKKKEKEEREDREEKKLQAKIEKRIENVKNYKVENTSEDIINFLIEAKKNIKNKNIDSDEYDMWFLKIDEVYEKAQETIVDEESLKKITIKYEELKKSRKNKNFGWFVFAYFYIVMIICAIFGLNGLFLVGLGISVLVCSIITFIYFNIDFKNVTESIEKIKIKDNIKNLICVVTSILSIMLICLGIILRLLAKIEDNRAYKNYYDKNTKKYNVSIDVDFKNNMLFDKCDVTLKIYDDEEYFEHGEDKTLAKEFPKGTHKLEFKSNDDKKIVELKVDGNIKVKYKLECISSGIEVRQVSKNN